MFKWLTNSYRNYRVIKPDWPNYKLLYYSISSIVSFIRQRLDTIYFLLTGKTYYQMSVKGEDKLREIYKNSGVVFITVHTGSYPLLGHLYNKFFSERELIVPFYLSHKVSIFPFFQKQFKKYGINIVTLGGAMKHIDPILKNGGSVALPLDAELAIETKYTKRTKFFGKEINLSTGPIFLAKKYHLPIIPVCIEHDGNKLYLVVKDPINYQNKTEEEVIDQIADSLEEMILLTLDKWQVYDEFLLKDI